MSEIQGKHNFGSVAPSLAEKPFTKEGAVLLKDADRKTVVRLADKGHLAGSVGAKLTASCLSAGWVERIGDTRGVRVTDVGRRTFLDILGLDLLLPAAA